MAWGRAYEAKAGRALLPAGPPATGSSLSHSALSSRAASWLLRRLPAQRLPPLTGVTTFAVPGRWGWPHLLFFLDLGAGAELLLMLVARSGITGSL